MSTAAAPIKLLNLYTRLPLLSEPAGEFFIIQAAELSVQERPKVYTSDCGKRVRKEQLLVPRQTEQLVLPGFEIYCLPADRDQAAKILQDKTAAAVAKVIHYAEGVSRLLSNGLRLVDSREWYELCVEVSRVRQALV